MLNKLFLIVVLPIIFLFLLVRPTSNRNTDAYTKAISHIYGSKNNYALKTQNSIIPSAFADSKNNIDAKSYIAIDFKSGEVLSGFNINQALPVASVTKIMTAIVALDLANPTDQIVISKNASKQIPTKIGVVEGEKMKISELLEAMLLTSANDAAQAINDGINTKYGANIFIDVMNEKAKYLGLKNTHFSNPQGFDSSQNYSTSSDLAILSYYALANYPLIQEIVNKDYVFLKADKNHKQFDLQNWNGLLGVYPGANGIKIGNTKDAGYTTIVTADRGGKKVLVVVLGAPDIISRDLWAANLLDESFDKTNNMPKIDITKQMLLAKYSTWKYWN